LVVSDAMYGGYCLFLYFGILLHYFVIDYVVVVVVVVVVRVYIKKLKSVIRYTIDFMGFFLILYNLYPFNVNVYKLKNDE
jgi:hypothetical protein